VNGSARAGAKPTAAQYSRALRIVPVGLFQRAKDLITEAGIVDVTVLMGWFTAVSLTLNAFDVPSNAVGLKQ
jgi:4-carboxymuconolactone decarboxylase